MARAQSCVAREADAFLSSFKQFCIFISCVTVLGSSDGWGEDLKDCFEELNLAS